MKSLPILAVLAISACGLAAQTLEPGLVGKYFHIGGHLDDYPDLSPSQLPNVKRIDAAIDFPDANTIRGITLQTQFYAEWTGKIRVSRADAYTFSLESDDGSELYIFDRKVVENGGPHRLRSSSGSVELPAGDLDIKIRFFQGIGTVGCRLYWQSNRIPKQIVPPDVLFHAAESVPVASFSHGPGLIGSYYEMAGVIENFPQFDLPVTPSLQRVDGRIDFPSAESFQFSATEYFCVNWTGRLRIEKPGAYTFYLRSDDGSRLYLDGKLVNDHGGQHSMKKEKAATVQLAAGEHDFKLDYFQSSLLACCKLSWEGPSVSKQIISESVFSH